MAVKNDLIDNDNVPKEDLDKIKVTSNAFFKKGFQFPEVARNDDASEQLEELEIAEKNFNANLDNVDLLKNFIVTAESVRKNLNKNYPDSWTDPAKGDVPQEGVGIDD